MPSTQNQVDQGCRKIAFWLVVILSTFFVCVAIGITLFALNIREHASNAVRDDLFPLIDSTHSPDDDRIAARVRVDNLIRAYQDDLIDQDDFIDQALALRDGLIDQIVREATARIAASDLSPQEKAAAEARLNEAATAYREGSGTQLEFLAQAQAAAEPPAGTR